MLSKRRKALLILFSLDEVGKCCCLYLLLGRSGFVEDDFKVLFTELISLAFHLPELFLGPLEVS